MAAAARPPGVTDARVPCPLCGGLIHPVAGRCKHCKQDLGAHRGARPQAAAPLPALAGSGNAAPIPVVAAPDSQPILPPRPTGRSPAQAEPRRLWRSWPIYVIIVAAVAIVGAVGVMMWPQPSEAGHHALSPPPAPEHMETNPLPPPSADPPGQVDPWGSPAPHAQLAPQHSTQPQAAPRHTPDPIPSLKDPFADDNNDPSDPLGGTNAFGGIAGLAGSNAAGLAITLGKHVCARLAKCGATGLVTATCDAYSQMPATPAPTCAEARRCIEHVDNLSCTDASDLSSPWEVMQQVQDCIDAMRC